MTAPMRCGGSPPRARPIPAAALAYGYCWAMFPRESEEACPIRALSARLRYGKYFADNGASVEITL